MLKYHLFVSFSLINLYLVVKTTQFKHVVSLFPNLLVCRIQKYYYNLWIYTIISVNKTQKDYRRKLIKESSGFKLCCVRKESNGMQVGSHHYKYLFTPHSSPSHSSSLFSWLPLSSTNKTNISKLSLWYSVFSQEHTKMSILVCQAQEKIATKSFSQKGDMGGLSFLQSMSDITSIVRTREDKAYVHPTVKRSVSQLNEKSLEMCTESLGAETGSESGDELTLLALEATAISRAHSKPQDEEKDADFRAKKATMSRSKSFPPPIKFVEESRYNRMVRSLGEDGRLVVQAIRISSPPRNFVAEREEGRLRLCLSPESSLLRDC